VTSHEGAPPSRDQERVVAEFRARGGKALYELFAAAYPQADRYQAQTSRQIPVAILTRR
jgi:hypothetical protein